MIRWPKACPLMLCVFILIACRPSIAAEYVLNNNEFGIIRDFAKIELSEVEVKNARIFVDIEKFVVPNASASENAELQKIALDDLGARFRLVAKKEDANYLVQIRMEEYVNYALRNRRKEPAQSYVMASICRYPIAEMDSDCGNTEYDVFYKGNKSEIFKRFFGMWLQNLVKGKVN